MSSAALINLLKILYKALPVILVGITALSIYIAYICYQGEKDALKSNVKLENEIKAIKEKQIKDNEIIAKNEETKIDLENESIKRQEQINELLKNEPCTNEPVPNNYYKRLYNRANQIRNNTDTTASIK